MQPRIGNPAFVVPNAMAALQSLAQAMNKSATASGVDLATLDLVYLRASQINGCSVCVEMHAQDLRKRGETDQRLFGVAAWRETTYFSEPERAVLALTESATRLSDRADAVPDDVWEQAAKYFDEPALATLVLAIAMINFWNRLNAATKQVAGHLSE